MLLGLDIGTTKVAAVICDASGSLLAVASAEHHATVPAPAGRSEQDPAILCDAAWVVVRQLPDPLRRQVRAVGVTGQMHGIIVLDAAGRHLTPLITWQDQRCVEDAAFLARLADRTGYALSTGFGCATLVWLAEHGRLPAGSTVACTIQDFAVMSLCAQSRPVTDPTDAASWGLFDLQKSAWDVPAIEAASLSPLLLPEVRPCGSRAGIVSGTMATELGLPPGIPATVAIGDNQASLVATLRDPDTDLALTIGTGAQLSAVLPIGAKIEDWRRRRAYENRPYPGGRCLVVAASLCGGSAWAWLAQTASSWQRDLGLPVLALPDLYRRLNEVGLAAAAGPTFRPTFLGERHHPGLRGSIEQITLENFTLGSVARGLGRAILENLREMLPASLLKSRSRILGSGNALRRNPLLQVLAQEVFGLPIALTEGREEAATGAAMLGSLPAVQPPRS